MTTQMDVAQLAGVSYMTVSRVVNNLDNVKPETRERVLRAIKELSYHPNAAARALTGGKTKNIGILYPREEYILSRPYFIDIVIKLEQHLSNRDYHLVLGSLRKGSRQNGEMSQLIAERRVDGLILFAPSADESSLKLLDAYKMPHVVLHGHAGDADSSYVDSDNRAGMALAIDHLIQLGHRRIGFVAGNLREGNALARLHMFKTLLPERGLLFDESLIHYGDWSLESGYAALTALSDRARPPSAIFFSNDQMALGGIRAAYDRHLHIPEDLSVVGYDDIPFASFSTPALTTVRQRSDYITKIAVEIIIDTIERRAPPRQEVVAPELVVRMSTGRPPARQRGQP